MEIIERTTPYSLHFTNVTLSILSILSFMYFRYVIFKYSFIYRSMYILRIIEYIVVFKSTALLEFLCFYFYFNKQKDFKKIC